jgi:hypothetical protein
VHAPAQALAQVGVQRPLELAGDGVGRADGEVLEALRLPQVERSTSGVPEVLVGELFDVVLRRAALAQATQVVVARQLVDQLGALDQAAQREDEQSCSLLVGEQHADGLVLLHDRLELAHRGCVVDHHLRADRDGQLDHLPEVGRRAREDRQAAGLAAVDPSAHERLDLAEVVVHGPMAVGSLSSPPEHPVELVLDVLMADQASPVHVEVARRDRCDISPDPCKLSDGGFGEDGHSTS